MTSNALTATLQRALRIREERTAHLRNPEIERPVLMTELLCPKCRVAMDTFERSGVTVEHCPDCGGVFLDRGELERLETAETGGANTSSATAAPGASGQALLGQLLNIARQYKGRRRF